MPKALSHGGLLAETLPSVIHTEAENERYLEILERLDQAEEPTPEQERLTDLLTLLAQDFEDRINARVG